MQLKKSLGQHFLKDEAMLSRISDAIGDLNPFVAVVEIGPGQGALTKYLIKKKHPNYMAVELDNRWAAYIPEHFPALRGKVINEDFLQTDLSQLFQYPTHVVGNFPYNISTEIIFKVIEHRATVTKMTGMFQKEVAVRIAAPPGNKEYGVTSVLTQAYFDCEYLFDVPPHSFDPPPKVMSGILQLKLKTEGLLNCDEKLFKTIVKKAFGQRRKTLRNSLKDMIHNKEILSEAFFDLRPERLSVKDFEQLTNRLKA